MLCYIAAFVTSSLLIAFSSKAQQQVERCWLFRYAPYALALLPLCLLAGVRDITVGTDTGGYGIFAYEAAVGSINYGQYASQLDSSMWDLAPLVAVYFYIAAKIAGCEAVYFALIELIVLLPILYLMYKSNSKYKGFIFFLYLMAYYIPSLNMMRQSIAMSVMLVSLWALASNREKLGVLLLVAAVGFHTSALVGVLLYFLHWVLFEKKDSTYKLRARSRATLLIIVVLSLLSILLFKEIASLFVDVPYLSRLANYGLHEGGELGTSDFIFLMLLISGSFILTRAGDNWAHPHTFYLLVISLSLFFYVLTSIDVTIGRMEDYVTLCCVPLLSSATAEKRETMSGMATAGLALVSSACLFRFLVCFCLLGFNQAVPYTSTILGI